MGDWELVSSGTTAVRVFTSLVIGQSACNAFPGIARLSSASNAPLIATYRGALDHGDSTLIGIAYSKVSTDGGYTWGSAVVIEDPAAGTGVGDTSVELLSNGTLLFSAFEQFSGGTDFRAVTYIGTVTGTTVSWGSRATIETFTDFTSTSSKVIELANGDLILPIYGKASGDPNTSCAIVKSTNHGVSWGSAITVKAGDASNAYNEANGVLLPNGDVLLMVRKDVGTSLGYWSFTSSNSGTSWSAGASAILANGPGRPSLLRMPNTGAILFLGRSTIPHVYSTSDDGGATWAALATFSDIGVLGVYSSACLLGANSAGVVFSEQQTGASGSVRFSRVLVG